MLRDLLTLKRADTLGQSQKSLYRLEEQAHIQELLETILAENSCFSIKDLALNGKDLIAAGAAPGRSMGTVLEAALQAVIDGELPNERGVLLDFALERLAEDSPPDRSLS